MHMYPYRNHVDRNVHLLRQHDRRYQPYGLFCDTSEDANCNARIRKVKSSRNKAVVFLKMGHPQEENPNVWDSSGISNEVQEAEEEDPTRSSTRAFLRFTASFPYSSKPIRFSARTAESSSTTTAPPSYSNTSAFTDTVTVAKNSSELVEERQEQLRRRKDSPTSVLVLVHEALQEYFQNNKRRNSIFIGSGNMEARECKTIAKDKKLLDGLVHRWKEELECFSKRKWNAAQEFLNYDPLNMIGNQVGGLKLLECTETEQQSSHQVHNNNGTTPGTYDNSSIVELRVRTNFLVFTIYAIATLGANLVFTQRNNVNTPTPPLGPLVHSDIMGTRQTKIPDKKEQQGTSSASKISTPLQSITRTQSPSLSAHQEPLLLPEYHFVLLDEDFEAEGPPPLVWIFNQLTGKGTRRRPSWQISRDGLQDRHLFHAFLHVYPSIRLRRQDGSVVVLPALENVANADGISTASSDDTGVGGTQNKIIQIEVIFHASSKAEINISFPALLLKILPAPKEKIERSGNVALSRNMERDVVPGIDKFRSNFIEFYREKHIA